MNDTRVAVTLYLHRDEYRAVAKIATARGANAHTLIEQLISAALKGPKPRQKAARARWARLRELHSQGLTDRDIADELGVTAEAVRQHRTAAELPSNARMGRPRKETTKGIK